MIRSGQLNRRIDLQAPSKAPDGMGGFTNTYTTVEASVPAAIWPISGKELQAEKTTLGISHRIRIRYRESVRGDWRILHKTKYFNIVSIINPGTDYRELDLMAREVI